MSELKLSPYEVIVWGEEKDRPLHRLVVTAFSADEAKSMAIERTRAALTATGCVLRIVRVDVIDGLRATPQQRQRGLFADLAELCAGESMDAIQGAAVNLLLTAVQRRANNLADAEARWNELAGRGLQALRRRYAGAADARDAAAESEIAKRLIA